MRSRMEDVGRSINVIMAALDVPFLLLPFRPSSDPSAARTFVRNFFYPPQGRERLRGSALGAELRMTEVMVGATPRAQSSAAAVSSDMSNVLHRFSSVS